MHTKHGRGDNSKILKRGLPFLYATHRHDLFYITVKYHQTIPYGFQIIERTRICIKSIEGEITQKYKSEGSHFCMRHIVITCST